MTSRIPTGFFSPAELAALVAVAPSLWWRGFIQLQSTTGMRTQEILRLPKSVLCPRSCSVQVTANPPCFNIDDNLVDLRAPMPAVRERTLQIPKAVARTLSDLAAHRWDDTYLFVPNWKLDQLWLHASSGMPMRTDDLCPDLNKGFGAVQQLAHARLVHLADARRHKTARWPLRHVEALRTTAIVSLAREMTPMQLAQYLGYTSTRPLLRYYCTGTRAGGAR